MSYGPCCATVRSSTPLSPLDNIIEIPVDTRSHRVGSLPVGEPFSELHDGNQSKPPRRESWLSAIRKQVGEVFVLEDSPQFVPHLHERIALWKGRFGHARGFFGERIYRTRVQAHDFLRDGGFVALPQVCDDSNEFASSINFDENLQVGKLLAVLLLVERLCLI